MLGLVCHHWSANYYPRVDMALHLIADMKHIDCSRPPLVQKKKISLTRREKLFNLMVVFN